MKIKIKNLTFKCIIGILPFERKKKQKVNINLSFNYKYKYKENSFIDYSEVVNTVESIMKKRKFLLIEEAIIYLNKQLKTKYDIKNLIISISKPDILDNCIVTVTN